MNLDIEFELENDGRWIAEVINLPGVLVYGHTKDARRRSQKVREGFPMRNFQASPCFPDNEFPQTY